MNWTPDTPAEAARLIAEALPVCESATKGPWHAGHDRRHNTVTAKGQLICRESYGDDANFIAAARAALPQALALLQAYRERVAELERNLATTLEIADGMDEGLREMVLQYGAPHHENCPEDDTCDCPTPRQINKALVLYAAHRRTMGTENE